MHCIRCLVLLFRVCSLKIRVRHYRCRSHSHISNLHVSAALIMSISMPHPPLQEHSFLTIIHTSASTFLQPYLLSPTKPIKQHISLPLSGREQIQYTTRFSFTIPTYTLVSTYNAIHINQQYALQLHHQARRCLRLRFAL